MKAVSKNIVNIIRYFTLNVACALDIFSLIFVFHQWIPIKHNILKYIIIGMLFAVLIATAIQTMIPINFDCYTKFIKILYIITIVIFFVCDISAMFKIDILNLERDTQLYDKYSRPAILPLISGILLFFIKKN